MFTKGIGEGEGDRKIVSGSKENFINKEGERTSKVHPAGLTDIVSDEYPVHSGDAELLGASGHGGGGGQGAAVAARTARGHPPRASNSS